MTTLLLAAGLAGIPTVAAADEPCRESHTETLEMMSMGKGRLGVFVLGITPELRKHYGVADDRGVLVARVDAGSPAAAAGVQAGDVIVRAGGRSISDGSDLVGAVASVAKGKPLALEVVRDHKPMTLDAKLTSDPVGLLDLDWRHDMTRWLEQHHAQTSSRSST